MRFWFSATVHGHDSSEVYVSYGIIMANFSVPFLESNDDLSLLTQEYKNKNGDEVEIDVDMENLMHSSVDSAVW